MEANVQSNNWMDRIMGDSEFNRFGLICVVLLVVGCLGGTAVGLGAINHTFSLIMVTIPTMLTLSLLLAVSPMRYIITSALVSVTIDVLMIVYFLLA
jgi:hypothetical protein